MEFVNDPTEIPQWTFLSVPVRAFERGVGPKLHPKRFELHFRVHQPNPCQNFLGCMLIMDFKFLSTGSGAKPI